MQAVQDGKYARVQDLHLGLEAEATHVHLHSPEPALTCTSIQAALQGRQQSQ